MRLLDSVPADRLARRLGAYLVDCLILFGGVLATQGLILAAGLNPLAARAAAGQPAGGVALNAWVLLTVTVPCLLYFAGWHSGPWAATPGKRWFGLRVANPADRPIGFRRALARSAVTLLPFEWNHVALAYLLPQAGEAFSPLAWVGIGLTWAVVLGYALCVIVDVAQRSPADWVSASRVRDR